MRGFTDYVIDVINKNSDFQGGIANIKATPSGNSFNQFEEQNNLYTLFIRGIKKGEVIDEKHLISSIQTSINPYEEYQAYLDLAHQEELAFVFSNTTESGIVFDPNETYDASKAALNFPAKLTALLFERFKHFNGDASKGLTIIPCELIENNAGILKKYIIQYAELWKLGHDFIQWIEEANSFHNTLVDRIVPGYPKEGTEFYTDQLDYEDQLMVVSEAFLLWVIEADEQLLTKIPFDKANEQILLVKDLSPYRLSKVRILNGSHTLMVPFSIMSGLDTVSSAIDNTFTFSIINRALYDEIIPSLPMDQEELKGYASDVLDRFKNPFLKHFLSSIALNSVDKFKVRNLPTLLEYVNTNQALPKNLTFAFACLIKFYKGSYKGIELPVQDDPITVEKFNQIWQNNDYHQIAKLVLSDKSIWGQDLTKIDQLTSSISTLLYLLNDTDIETAYQTFMKN